MFINKVDLHFLSKKEQDLLLYKIKQIKHKLVILLMLDAGLRVSEAVTLKLENFDFKKRLLSVKSLKKKENNKKIYRTIPLSDRLYRILAEYIYQNSSLSKQDYLFPSSNSKPITRNAINNLLIRLNKKLNIKHLHPHALRHSFATNHVVAGTPLENIKEMLGHERFDMTLIYAHIPQELLRKNINAVSTDKVNFFKRVIIFFFGKKQEKLINIPAGNASICVGRVNEIAEVENLVNRDINTLILGDIGTGKSHLLNNVNLSKKALTLDDTDNMKASLIMLLLYLYKNDKQAVYEILHGDLPLDKAKTKINRLSVSNICEEIKKIVEPKEYILIIDSIDRITPKSVKALEELKDTFTILTTARNVAINKSSFLWNFEIIKLKTLERKFALELIHRLSYDLEIEDYELFRNHIYEQTDGNPRAIYEIIERYRKEPVISSDVVREIRHFGSLREIDMSVAIILVLACMAILRYLTGELDNSSYRFIGGAAMILLIIFRYLFRYTKRQII